MGREEKIERERDIDNESSIKWLTFQMRTITGKGIGQSKSLGFHLNFPQG